MVNLANRKLPAPLKIKDTFEIQIRVKTAGGGGLYWSLVDAVKLAAREWCDVVLVHNGREFKVTRDDFLKCIKERRGRIHV